MKFASPGEAAPIEVPSIAPPSILILLMFCVAILPKPKDSLAIESLSTVHSVPSDTIKAPSVCSKLAIVSRFSSASCFVSMYALIDCWVAR